MMNVAFDLRQKLFDGRDHFEGQRETSTRLRKCSHGAMTRVS